MGVVFTQDSNYAKEMRLHEAHHTQFGPPGRPYTFKEFPKRLYLAARVEGKITIVDAQTVNDDHEERNLLSRGFCFGQDKAIEAIELEQRRDGELAAEREYAIQHNRLSERATAEVRTAEAAAGARHVPEIPETPIKRRGRKPKSEAVNHA